MLKIIKKLEANHSPLFLKLDRNLLEVYDIIKYIFYKGAHMKIIISPSKGMKKDPIKSNVYNEPLFLDKAYYLANEIKGFSITEIESSFKINNSLANDVYNYYQCFQINTAHSINMYDGVAFKALDYQSLNDNMKNYLNDRLYILSALYGILRPNDSISIYRLDFINNPFEINLYKYWDIIKDYFSNELVINLASKEYSKMLNKKNMIDIYFYTKIGDKLKEISVTVKKARGLFVRFMAINQIEDIKKIKLFNELGFKYNDELSKENKIVFIN